MVLVYDAFDALFHPQRLSPPLWPKLTTLGWEGGVEDLAVSEREQEYYCCCLVYSD